MRFMVGRAGGDDAVFLINGDQVHDLTARIPGIGQVLWGVIGSPELMAKIAGAADLGPAIDAASITPSLPIKRPGTIICLGLNYVEHIKEDGYDIPDYPALFMRGHRSIMAAGAPMVRPTCSERLDYEAELMMILGKGGRHIAEAGALGHVVGYTVFNDGSVNDYQRKSHQWAPGKNIDKMMAAPVTPIIAPDAPAVAKAADEIAKEFPTMQNEFAAQNQVYLATGVVLDTYQVFSKAPINGLADMQGMKVAGAGMNMRYLEGIEGAVGVRGGLTDFYNMVQTGMVDAAMLWPEAAATFKIAEVAPYMLRADLGAVNSKTITVNKDYWDKLPEEVQGVLKDVAVAYRDHVAGIATDNAQASRDAYVAAGGTIVEMDADQRAAWANAMPNIAAEWAADLDAKGEPGTEMLQAYMAKLEAAGFTPVRDWSAMAGN